MLAELIVTICFYFVSVITINLLAEVLFALGETFTLIP